MFTHEECLKINWKNQIMISRNLELVSKELNHLAACLCWGFDFYEVKKVLSFFKKKRKLLLHF